MVRVGPSIRILMRQSNTSTDKHDLQSDFIFPITENITTTSKKTELKLTHFWYTCLYRMSQKRNPKWCYTNSILHHTMCVYTGLLTGCVGAGPHNLIKAAQSHTISENMRNPAQYGKIWLKI